MSRPAMPTPAPDPSVRPEPCGRPPVAPIDGRCRVEPVAQACVSGPQAGYGLILAGLGLGLPVLAAAWLAPTLAAYAGDRPSALPGITWVAVLLAAGLLLDATRRAAGGPGPTVLRLACGAAVVGLCLATAALVLVATPDVGPYLGSGPGWLPPGLGGGLFAAAVAASVLVVPGHALDALSRRSAQRLRRRAHAAQVAPDVLDGLTGADTRPTAPTREGQ